MKTNHRFLIVSDLDGTLLDDEKKIQPKTKELLQELEKEGHVVALASGRPPRAMIQYYDELGLKGPFISYNGASVFDPKGGDFKRFDQFFSKESVFDFLSHFQEGELVNCFAESEKVVYFSTHDEGFNSMFNSQNMIIKYGPLEETLDEDVYAFVFQVKQGGMEKANSVPLYDETLFLRHWYELDTVAEFGSLERSKSTGIRLLQKYYHIDRIHTIAFGDAENDVEMLSDAGVPYAMKNANPHLIQIVKNVTLDDNNHEGIYKTLKNFFDQNKKD